MKTYGVYILSNGARGILNAGAANDSERRPGCRIGPGMTEERG